MYKAIQYGNKVKVICSVPVNRTTKEKKEKAERLTNSSESVLRRARSKIRTYVECDNFTHFCTFTFSQRDFDRHDIQSCREFITNFFTREFPDSNWLLVPELHEDGSLHFHGFISFPQESLLFGYTKRDKKGCLHKHFYSDKINAVIGRNDFQKLSSMSTRSYAVSYVLKYVQKAMDVFLGLKSYYFCSRRMKTPTFLHKFNSDDVVAFQVFLRENNLRYINGKYFSAWELTLEQWNEFFNYRWYYLVQDEPFTPLEYEQISLF